MLVLNKIIAVVNEKKPKFGITFSEWNDSDSKAEVL